METQNFKKFTKASIAFSCLLLVAGIIGIILPFINMAQYSLYVGYAGIVLLIALLVCSLDTNSPKFIYVVGVYLAFAFWLGYLIYCVMNKSLANEIDNPALFNALAMGGGDVATGLVGLLFSLYAQKNNENIEFRTKLLIVTRLIFAIICGLASGGALLLYHFGYTGICKFLLAGSLSLSIALSFSEAFYDEKHLHYKTIIFTIGIGVISFCGATLIDMLFFKDSAHHLTYLIAIMSFCFVLFNLYQTLPVGRLLSWTYKNISHKAFVIIRYIIHSLFLITGIAALALMYFDFITLGTYLIYACAIYGSLQLLYLIKNNSVWTGIGSIVVFGATIGLSIFAFGYSLGDNSTYLGAFKFAYLIITVIFAIYSIIVVSKKRSV